MMAVLCTDGQLSLSELHRECITGKWIPLLIYKKRFTDCIYLPVFAHECTAKDFIKRNLPKKWTHAGIILADSDIDVIQKKGWSLQHFDFPRRIASLPDIQLGFEIHEFTEVPDFKTSKL